MAQGRKYLLQSPCSPNLTFNDFFQPYFQGKEIFSWFDGTFNSAEDYVGRIILLDQRDKTPKLGQASINLTSIQETDGGWYQCRAYFPNRSPDTLNNGSFFHLSIDGNTLLKIPPINQTVLEGEAAQLR